MLTKRLHREGVPGEQAAFLVLIPQAGWAPAGGTQRRHPTGALSPALSADPERAKPCRLAFVSCLAETNRFVAGAHRGKEMLRVWSFNFFYSVVYGTIVRVRHQGLNPSSSSFSRVARPDSG